MHSVSAIDDDDDDDFEFKGAAIKKLYAVLPRNAKSNPQNKGEL